MAKRRSLNRRWSRKSGNSSVFLNDDTKVIEEDSMYWQYLNTTNSRPPSGTNVTAATAILDPDSVIIDPNMSDEEYLQKYNDDLPQPEPGDISKANSHSMSKPEKPPEETSLSESEDSTALHKKKVNLRKSRRPNPQEMFGINSSDSEPDPPLSSQSQRTQESLKKSRPQATSPQDSSSSIDTEILRKQRAQFKRTGAKLLQKSLATSGDDSVIGSSQQTRRTSIRPRTTFLKRSSENGNLNSPQPVKVTVEKNADSDSDVLISQPRKLFKRVRKPKESVNPFTAVLDETEEANTIEGTPKSGSQEDKTKEDNGSNFILHMSPSSSENPQQDAPKARSSQRQRKASQASTSSISEEMIITPRNNSGTTQQSLQNVVPNREETIENTEDVEGVEDSDDFQSFESDNENNQNKESAINNKNNSQHDEKVRETLSSPAKGEKSQVFEESDEEISGNEQETSQPAKSVSTPAEEVSEDSDDEAIITTKGHRSVQLVKNKSVHGETSQSPIISGSIADQTSTSDSDEKSVAELEPPESKKMRTTRSLRSKSLRSPTFSKSTDVSGNSKNKILIDSTPAKSTQSFKLQHSQIIPQEQSASEDEVDVQTISEDELIFALKSGEKNGKASEELKQRKTSVAAETKEIRRTSRAGPRSSKIMSTSPTNLSGSSTSPEPQKNQKRSQPGLRSSGIASKFSTKSPLRQENLPALQTDVHVETSKTFEAVEEDSTERPGPKSFKKFQRSILLTSKTSKKLRLSAVPSKTQLEDQEPFINEEGSVGESSIQKDMENRRRTDPSAYELPDRDRSPSVSLSDSDIASSRSRTLAKNKRPADISESNTRSPINHRKKLKKVEVHANKAETQQSTATIKTLSFSEIASEHSTPPHAVIEDAEDMGPFNKKTVPTRVQTNRKSSIASQNSVETVPRRPLSPRVVVKGKDDNNSACEDITAPITNQLRQKSISSNDKPETSKKPSFTVPEARPSRSSLQPKSINSTATSATSLAAEKRKLRQLKIDALMKSQKSQQFQRTQDKSSAIPSNTEEFHKKLVAIKEKIRAQSAREEEAGRKRAEKQKAPTNKKGVFPKATGKKKTEKIVDKAYIVNGKIYKRPKLSRPKHWATNKLYKFLWKKMEPEFGLETRVRSEKFVNDLAETVTVITRRKKYNHYKDELDALLKKMARLGIIKNRFEFNGFCYDFLPYEFRVKVVPMLQFGNTHNIPFEPEKLMVPILEGDE